MGKTIPAFLTHEFTFACDLSHSSLEAKEIYRCAHCSAWTVDPDEEYLGVTATNLVCPARNRRVNQRRLKERREPT